MPIRKLAFLVRTTALDQSRKFYTDVLCFRDGLRPPFKFPGYWLYRGGDEADFGAVHLIGIDKDIRRGWSTTSATRPRGGGLQPSSSMPRCRRRLLSAHASARTNGQMVA